MSDKVSVTQGTGTDIATDQLADLRHVQLIKLMDGTEDSTARIPGDATNGLYVNVKALPATLGGVTQSGSWTVTANAGTNLNTSALALETGGNLATIKTNTDNLNLSQASTTSGQKGNLILAATTTSAPTYTTAQSNPLSLQTDGSLRTAITNTVTVGSHNVTNAGTFAVQAAQSGTWNITNISGTVSLPTGASTEATLSALNTKINTEITSDFDTGAGTQTMKLVGLALPASGGAVVAGTSSNPLASYLTNGGNTATITAGGALTITGAVTQSGTWNINNVSGTVSLPTGAATAAKQPALGIAGSASADVITVQGIASMTALKVDGSAVTQPVSGTITANIGTSGSLALDASVTGLQVSQGSTTSGQKGSLLMGAVTTSSPTYTTAQTSPLSLDTSGGLRVSIISGGGSGGTASSYGSSLPATGTAAGFNDGTNMQAARVFDADSGAGTQYVLGVNLRSSASGGSVETFPAPSALTTAIATPTTTQVFNHNLLWFNGNATWERQRNAENAYNGTGIGVAASGIYAQFDDTSPTATTENSFAPIRMSANRNLYGTIRDAAGNERGVNVTSGNALVVDGSASTQPVSGTVTANAGTGTFNIQSNASVNVAQLNGTTTDTNSGNKSAGTLRVVIATDQPNLTTALNVSATQSGTWTVQPGNTANSTPWLVTNTPATTGGLTTYHLVSAGSTNAASVKASAGQLFGWFIYNSNAAARKVAFHNISGTPTAGASIFFSLVIPPLSGANVMTDSGIAFSSGIGITTVTGLADSDSTAVAANDLTINLFYK